MTTVCVTGYVQDWTNFTVVVHTITNIFTDQRKQLSVHVYVIFIEAVMFMLCEVNRFDNIFICTVYIATDDTKQ